MSELLQNMQQLKKKRQEKNADFLKRFFAGESLSLIPPDVMNYPPRTRIIKDNESIKKIFGESPKEPHAKKENLPEK